MKVESFQCRSARQTYWLCRCECGRAVTITTGALRSGATKSCGCLWAEKIRTIGTKHGHTSGMNRPRLYGVWSMIKQRCLNPKNKKYKYYGARGITICEEWAHDYQAFYEWAINNGYELGLEIERKNNDGNYCPSNCTWVTHKEQERNQRANHLITINGQTQVLAVWSEQSGISRSKIMSRIKRGWGNDRLLEPVKPKQKAV